MCGICTLVGCEGQGQVGLEGVGRYTVSFNRALEASIFPWKKSDVGLKGPRV